MASIRLKPAPLVRRHTLLPSARRHRPPTSIALSGHPQSGCPEMREFNATYNALNDAYRSYLTAVPVRVLDPQLPTLFAKFTIALDAFTRVASGLFAAVRAPPAHQPTSAISRAARELACRWAALLSALDGVSQGGVAPIVAEIAARMRRSAESIHTLDHYFRTPKLETDPAGKALTKQFRELLQLYASFSADGDIDATVRDVSVRTRAFFERLASIFGNAAEIRQVLTGVLGNCGEILNFVNGLNGHEPLINQFKTEALRFNWELSNLQKKLNLPFGVDIVLTTKRSDTETDELGLDETPDNIVGLSSAHSESALRLLLDGR